MISLYSELKKQKEYDAKKLTAWHCSFWSPKGQTHTADDVIRIAGVIKNGPHMPILLKNDKEETGPQALFKNENFTLDERNKIYDFAMQLNEKEAHKIFMGIANKITSKIGRAHV